MSFFGFGKKKNEDSSISSSSNSTSIPAPGSNINNKGELNIDNDDNWITLTPTKLRNNFPHVAVNGPPPITSKQIPLSPERPPNSCVWQVIGTAGARVRAGQDMTSDLVKDLKKGQLVYSIEKIGNRIHIIEPCEGWVSVVSNANQYVIMIPADATIAQRWLYRVVCAEGAYLRQGTSLGTKHLGTIPYGSIIECTSRMINSQGLPRLQTRYNGEVGYISQVLNPLAGAHGPIVEGPLEMFHPLVYRVILDDGCVVRSGRELNSMMVQKLPKGFEFVVVEKTFSEHPANRCIKRLKIGYGGGWVSERLNIAPPNDAPIIEFVRVATDEEAALGCVEGHEIEMEEAKDLPNIKLKRAISIDQEEACIICLDAKIDAVFVHNQDGHMAACLQCARAVFASSRLCPICRENIEKVIQVYRV